MQHIQIALEDSSGQGNVLVHASCFAGDGGVEEIHLVATVRVCRGFALDLADLTTAYFSALERLGLAASSTVLRRIFLSDIANQAGVVQASPLATSGLPFALSLVEQPPLPEHKLSLWAYHVKDPAGLRKDPAAGGVCLDRGAIRQLWLAGLGQDRGECPRGQSIHALGELVGTLASLGGSLAEHAIRTWFFVANVDRNYAGLVRGRKEVFDGAGLTADTHYLASTGIEGRLADPRRLVALDAYALAGADPRQIGFLHAPDHLGPTNLYGVTFERGTRVDFRDRRHLYISGTASIDPAGTSLHLLDPIQQARRAAENMDALLADGGCVPGDMAQLIVYLRDGADFAGVQPFFARRYPGVPTAVVRAPVCRPEWLVEIECIAIRSHTAPDLPPF